MALTTNVVERQVGPELILGPPISVLIDENERSVVTRPGDPNHTPPAGIARGVFDAGNGLALSYYYTTETNINNGSVAGIGFSGFKSDLVLNPKETGFLTKRNIPFGWLAINNPGRGLIFLDDAKRACKKFIVDPPPPIKKIIDSRIPTTLDAHSTGAMIKIEQANNSEYYDFLADHFCGMVIQSPMLETAPFYDSLSPQMQSRVLDWVISRNRELLPEEFRLGRYWLKACGRRHTADPDREYTRPTLGQVGVIRDNAREEILEKQGPHLLEKGDLPVAFFLGAKDKFADPTTSIDFARKIGGAVFLDQEASHAPVCENRRNMAQFVRTKHEMARGTFDAKQHPAPAPQTSGRSLFSFAL